MDASAPTGNRPHFLEDPEHSPEAQRLFDEDLEDVGYVMNLTRLWAYLPEADGLWSDLIDAVTRAGDLSFRQRSILVTACASTMGDSYCSLAWGSRLASVTDPDTAAGVLRGDDSALSPSEQILARWARQVASDPSGTQESDVHALRDAGYTDRQIFAITAYVANRIAFSTVNDALGASPDPAFRRTAPEAVLSEVTFGRQIGN